MMIFPIKDLLSEQECYQFLLRALHPNGLSCPCGRTVEDSQRPHTSDRAPIVEYKCRSCGKVFNVFTGTMWSKSHYDCRTITLLIRGFAQGVPSLHLAKELGLDYEAVLNRRHRWQEQALKKSRDSLTGPRDRIRRDVSERWREGTEA
jgi:transposase-like protein